MSRGIEHFQSTSHILKGNAIKFLMIKGFVKHLRINISDMKIERRFDDSLSSLSSSNHMIELIVYIYIYI